MKECPNCHTNLSDEALFCPSCGTNLSGGAQSFSQDRSQGGNPGAGFVPQPDPYDHTAEFDPRDISANKVISMLVYLWGVIGIIIALLASSSSPYVGFHVRQALKFSVIDILLGLAAGLLCWTIIVPIAAGIFALVLMVVKIVCFFQICSGKAKEPPIIRDFKFLR